MAELYPQTVKCVSVSSYRIFALLIFLCSQSKIQVTVRMTFAMFICWSNDVMCRAHSHTLKLSPSQSQVFNHTHTTLSLRPTACKENKRPLTFTSTRQGARVCGLLFHSPSSHHHERNPNHFHCIPRGSDRCRQVICLLLCQRLVTVPLTHSHRYTHPEAPESLYQQSRRPRGHGQSFGGTMTFVRWTSN